MENKFLKNKSILITGGTGTFGQAFTNYLLKNSRGIKKLIIFSRDELKQFEMAERYDLKKYKNLRFFLGDIRDKQRLRSAFEGVDYIIHAAALKQVTAAEYNPIETVKTNILGSQNIIDAAIETGVKKIISLSTDKAVSPINLYGATKLCAEKLFVSANNIVGKKNISFSCVRYGNVLGSRGSVLPIFLKQMKNNYFTITDKEMTRFNLTIEEGVKLVLWTLENSIGKEIVIPKIPSLKVIDLAKSLKKELKLKIIGTRAGEKIHEELMTESESINALELKDKYILLPTKDPILLRYYRKKFKKIKIPKKFSYNSNLNKFLSIKNIKTILKKENFI